MNAIAPGVIDAPMTEARIQDRPYRGVVLECAPLRRAAQPEELASVLAFLATKDAFFVTGQVIAVDGGRLAGGAASSGRGM